MNISNLRDDQIFTGRMLGEQVTEEDEEAYLSRFEDHMYWEDATALLEDHDLGLAVARGLTPILSENAASRLRWVFDPPQWAARSTHRYTLVNEAFPFVAGVEVLLGPAFDAALGIHLDPIRRMRVLASVRPHISTQKALHTMLIAHAERELEAAEVRFNAISVRVAEILSRHERDDAAASYPRSVEGDTELPPF